MNAHWLDGGESVLVTGTQDPEIARQYIANNEPDMYEFAENDPGYPCRGNIVPQHPEAEYRWVWYLNENGRTRAVTFG